MLSTKSRIAFWAVGLVSLMAYVYVSYFIERQEFGLFISLYIALYAIYLLLNKGWAESKISSQEWIGLAIALRISMLFFIPNLSDDIYRFIWDGNLLKMGINPFAFTPEEVIKQNPGMMSEELFEKMNSQTRYTIYPPISQLVFWIGAVIAGQQVWLNSLIMKVILLAADVGSIIMLKRILSHLKLNPNYILLFALNPLLILEFTGNVHFEGVMMFFVLWFFYLILKDRYIWAFVVFTLAVNTKLVPLIAVPYIVFSLGWKRTIQFGAIGILGTFLLHIPLIDAQFLGNFGNSLDLYFRTFEFNASIYYIVRWVGFQVKGYNIIQTAGPVLSIISTVLIIITSWRYKKADLKNFPQVYTIILTAFYLFSTTVHPWYIASLIFLVPLTGYLYPIAWAAMIALTYETYSNQNYDQNVTLIGLEYAVVFVFLIIDIINRNQSVEERLRRLTSGFNFKQISKRT